MQSLTENSTTAHSLEISPATRWALLKLLDYDKDKTEDALQEAALQALRKASKFEGRSKYSTWFHRVAINTTLMLKRQERVRRCVAEFVPVNDDSGDFVSLCDDMPDKALNPEERLLALERNQRLREAILQLSPKRREMVLRFALKGQRGRHQAEDFRAFNNTEKARLHKAMRDLRNELGVPE